MKKNITASLVNMYYVCKREMWLHYQNVNMEQTSDIVYEGKLIGETTYLQRPEKYTEIEISINFEGVSLNAKIDFYDANHKIVHEIKKSNKLENAHIAQVKFYLFLLEKNGIEGASGVLEYPKLKQKHIIDPLKENDRTEIKNAIQAIQTVLNQEFCPELVKKTYCKTCSYYDFCYINE